MPADWDREGDELVEKSIEELLGVSVYFSEIMCDEFNRTHHWPASDYERWLVYVDTCGEVPDIEEPFEWISREQACMGKWLRKNWNEDGDDLRKEIERMFEELNRVWMTAGWRGRVTAWVREVLRGRHLTIMGKFRMQTESEKSITMKSKVSQVNDARFQRWKGDMVKGGNKRLKLNIEEDGCGHLAEQSDALYVKSMKGG